LTDRAGRTRVTTGRIRQRAGDENDAHDENNDKNSPNEFKTDEKGIRP
jgi:hypothetical protein